MTKQAVINTGSKQYFVSVGDQLKVELLQPDLKTINWQPLLVIDGDKILVGQPLVDTVTVKATVVEPMVKEDKIVSIRFRAKKRIHKRRGHRQKKTVVKIISID